MNVCNMSDAAKEEAEATAIVDAAAEATEAGDEAAEAGGDGDEDLDVAALEEAQQLLEEAQQLQDSYQEMTEKLKQAQETQKETAEITSPAPAAGGGEADELKRIESDQRSIYIGNVNYTATDDDLLELFAACGEIERVKIGVDKWTKKPKGFAYMEFKEKDSVELAITLDGEMLKDRPIKVSHKRTNDAGHSSKRRLSGGGGRSRGGRRGGRRGGSYRGGYRGGRRGRGRGGYGYPY